MFPTLHFFFSVIFQLFRMTCSKLIGKVTDPRPRFHLRFFFSSSLLLASRICRTGRFQFCLEIKKLVPASIRSREKQRRRGKASLDARPKRLAEKFPSDAAICRPESTLSPLSRVNKNPRGSIRRSQRSRSTRDACCQITDRSEIAR